MKLSKARSFQEYEAFIPDFEAFCDSLHTPLPRCLRVNTQRITPLELTRTLRAQGYPVRSTSVADYLLECDGLDHPGSTLEAAFGYFISQALTSAIAAIALDPRPEEFICDLCAAPGCKTTHMAQLMINRGLIVANDSKQKRLRALENNIRRLGVTNVVITSYAGQNFPQRWRFDRVLADVPCSGEGIFRFSSSPTQPPRRQASRFLPRIQRDLIIRAFDLLADKGILLYSTCTYSPDENEEVVQYLLDNRPAEVLPIDVPAPYAPGIVKWRNRSYDRQINRCWRIYPHQLNSVGFFLARICRRSRPK